MASFGDLAQYLQSKYPVQAISPTQLSLTFHYTDQRSQQILIDTFEALQRPWVCIRTRVCAHTSLSPQEALARNRQLVIGHLCIEDGYYVLRNNYLLTTLAAEEIELGLLVLARTADELEAALEAGQDRF